MAVLCAVLLLAAGCNHKAKPQASPSPTGQMFAIPAWAQDMVGRLSAVFPPAKQPVVPPRGYANLLAVADVYSNAWKTYLNPQPLPPLGFQLLASGDDPRVACGQANVTFNVNGTKGLYCGEADPKVQKTMAYAYNVLLPNSTTQATLGQIRTSMVLGVSGQQVAADMLVAYYFALHVEATFRMVVPASMQALTFCIAGLTLKAALPPAAASPQLNTQLAALLAELQPLVQGNGKTMAAAISTFTQSGVGLATCMPRG